MDKKTLLIEFIEERMLRESKLLFEHELYSSLYTHIAQGIEFIGAFTDSKPLRAKDQSRIRFDAAIKEFFPPVYQAVNQNSWFYHKYRVHVIHTFLPSSYVVFADQKNNPDLNHLQLIGSRRVIQADQLCIDYQQALVKLIHGIQQGNYPLKMLQGLN
jgi:hypothetical protein